MADPDPPFYSDGRVTTFTDWQWREAGTWGRLTGLTVSDRTSPGLRTKSRRVLTTLPVLLCGVILIAALIVFKLTT